MVFHWCLSDSKSSQVSRSLSILVDLNNAVVWMVPPWPLISKSSSPCSNPFVTVLRAPIAISIPVSFMFHCFFQLSSNVLVLISLLAFIQFYPVVRRNLQNPLLGMFFSFLFLFIFLLTIIWSSRVAKIW